MKLDRDQGSHYDTVVTQVIFMIFFEHFYIYFIIKTKYPMIGLPI